MDLDGTQPQQQIASISSSSTSSSSSSSATQQLSAPHVSRGMLVMPQSDGSNLMTIALRTAFVAEPGYVLLSADYAQIELRLMAQLSGDENLIRMFTELRNASMLLPLPSPRHP